MRQLRPTTGCSLSESIGKSIIGTIIHRSSGKGTQKILNFLSTPVVIDGCISCSRCLSNEMRAIVDHCTYIGRVWNLYSKDRTKFLGS